MIDRNSSRDAFQAGLATAGLALLMIIIIICAIAIFAATKSRATWKPEYGGAPQAVQDWFENAATTPLARNRLNIWKCCDQSERVRTKFVPSATGEWAYYPDPNCTHAGCPLKAIPGDVVHEETIRALNPRDDKLPEFEAMRREGVLFIYKGAPSCFWPPEPGG